MTNPFYKVLEYLNLLKSFENMGVSFDLNGNSMGTEEIVYEEPPTRTALRDDTKITASSNTSSIPLATSALILQKQNNLKSANEDLRQALWFEKMKDKSEIYKQDQLNKRIEARTLSDLLKKSAEVEAKKEQKAQEFDLREKLLDKRLEYQKSRDAVKFDIEREKLKIKKELQSMKKDEQAEMMQMVEEEANRLMAEDGVNPEDLSLNEKGLYYIQAWDAVKTIKKGVTDKPSVYEKKKTDEKELDDKIKKVIENPAFEQITNNIRYDEITKEFVDPKFNPIPKSEVIKRIKSVAPDLTPSEIQKLLQFYFFNK